MIKTTFIKVVTLAVYSFFVSSLMGRQFLDPERKLSGHEVRFRNSLNIHKFIF